MKNYFSHSFYIALAVVILLSGVALISPSEVFGFTPKQANIYSDVINQKELRGAVGLTPEPFAQQQERMRKITERSNQIEHYVDSVMMAQREAKRKAEERKAEMIRRAATEVPKGVVALEDFSTDGYHLASFFDKLSRSKEENVRIAVMGDSFIEGDIMTSDLREQFQLNFGGAGVGFVPITSQVSKFRGTVQHSFSSGWMERSVVKNPQMEGGFIPSGYNYELLNDTGWVEYSGNSFRKNIKSFGRVRLLFKNFVGGEINAIINGGAESLTFQPEISEEIQYIEVEGDISKIRFEFSNAKGMIAYGVLLDNSTGISVDNFSVRGNSGIAMTTVSKTLCQQMKMAAQYDLIILEYGLNVVEEEVLAYVGYRNRMVKVVEHIKECYPGVPIIVMGVSDRSTMEEGDFVTMPGVVAMDQTQRDIARRCQVVYWSTLNAMRSLGGMSKFVEYGWAAKDYTHIGSAGGRKIGQKFYEAILADR